MVIMQTYLDVSNFPFLYNCLSCRTCCSWQLWSVLRALEYSHLSTHHQAALCCDYASQLESLGLWHWAVFVLLHIGGGDDDASATQRELSVRQLLERHLVLDSDKEAKQREAFLQERLNVPAEWIHQAKVVMLCYKRWYGNFVKSLC